MSGIQLNPDNSFAVRPKLGQRYRNLETNQIYTVGASWKNGVVFEEHRTASALSLTQDFVPDENAPAKT